AVTGSDHPDLVMGGHEVVWLQDRFEDLPAFITADGTEVGTDVLSSAVNAMAARTAGQAWMEKHPAASGGIRRPLQTLQPGVEIVETGTLLGERLAQCTGHQIGNRRMLLRQLLQLRTLIRGQLAVDQGTQSFVAQNGMIAPGKGKQGVDVFL